MCSQVIFFFVWQPNQLTNCKLSNYLVLVSVYRSLYRKDFTGAGGGAQLFLKLSRTSRNTLHQNQPNFSFNRPLFWVPNTNFIANFFEMVNCNCSMEKMYLVQHLITLKFFFSSAITCKQNTRFFKIYFQQNSIFIKFKKSTIFIKSTIFFCYCFTRENV